MKYEIHFMKDITLNVVSHAGSQLNRVTFNKGESIKVQHIIKHSYNLVTIIGESYNINLILNDETIFIIKEIKNAAKFYTKVANIWKTYSHAVSNANEYLRNTSTDKIEDMVKKYLPHGSGFDNGTEFNWFESNSNKLVFNTSFHHMDENGGYDGWTDHKVIITPDLKFGFNVKITGKNRNNIKDYIHDCFSDFTWQDW